MISDSAEVDPGHWKLGDEIPLVPLPPWKASFGVSHLGMEERDLALWSMMWELGNGQTRYVHTDSQAAIGDCFEEDAPGEFLKWGWAWHNGAMRGYFFSADQSDYPFPDLPQIRKATRFDELAQCGSWEAWIHERPGADRVYLWSWPRADVRRAMSAMKGDAHPRLTDVLGKRGILQMFQVHKPALIVFSNAPLEGALKTLEIEFRGRIDRARSDLKRTRTKDDYLAALNGIVGEWYVPPYTGFIE